jgi:hypothetical protein
MRGFLIQLTESGDTDLVGPIHGFEDQDVVLDLESAKPLLLPHRDLGNAHPSGLCQSPGK